MTYKEIQELIKLINKTELSEFKIKDGEFELLVRTKNYQKGSGSSSQPIISVPSVPSSYPTTVPAPAAPAPAPSAPASSPANEEAEDTSNYLEVKSPMVGTFYRSPSPDKPPYIKVGDNIDAGSMVCVIEAMKLFNEIESEVSGKIVKVMVEDAQPVEYDQVLFLVDPKG